MRDEFCNWKCSVENYSECYHCPSNHQTFAVAVFRDFHPLERRQLVHMRDEFCNLFSHAGIPFIHRFCVVIKVDEEVSVEIL
ncbi:MAG: SRPBCC family protein [Pseudomonadota bacterium]